MWGVVQYVCYWYNKNAKRRCHLLCLYGRRCAVLRSLGLGSTLERSPSYWRYAEHTCLPLLNNECVGHVSFTSATESMVYGVICRNRRVALPLLSYLKLLTSRRCQSRTSTASWITTQSLPTASKPTSAGTRSCVRTSRISPWLLCSLCSTDALTWSGLVTVAR